MYPERANEPQFAPFHARFARFIPHSPITLTDISGAMLRDICLMKLKKSRSGVCGVDGWRWDELAMLPITLWEAFAALLNEVETSGRWPRALTTALVTLIPKGKAADDPFNLRPITVTSVICAPRSR